MESGYRTCTASPASQQQQLKQQQQRLEKGSTCASAPCAFSPVGSAGSESAA